MNGDENNVEQVNQTPEHNNIKLIYDYTHYQIALVNRSIDICVAKLSLVFGLTVGLICSFPVKTTIINNWVLGLEISSLILCLATLCFCVAGFQPKAAGDLASASFLLDNQYYNSDEMVRLVVTRTALKGLEQLTELRNFRANKAKIAIWYLLVAVVFKTIAITVLKVGMLK